MSVSRMNEEKKSLKARIAVKDAILQLQKNKTYQAVIEKGFMEEDCARNARISGSLTMAPDAREDALRKAQAAGHLAEYLHAKIMMGIAAESTLESLLEEEAELVSGSEEDI